MPARRHVVALVLASALLVAPAARADERIFAANVQYTNPNVTMDQGEPLFFRNFDVQRHDVTATATGADGKPLFETPLIGLGEEAFVEGAQYLITGVYSFFCKVHPQMKGNLNVTAAGTPVPRPAPGTTSADTAPPNVGTKIRSSRLSRVRRTRRLATEVTVDEAAKVALRVTTRASGRTVTIARGSVQLSGAGTRRRALRLTAAGRSALSKRTRAAITLTARAVDSAGNSATARARRTLRR